MHVKMEKNNIDGLEVMRNQLSLLKQKLEEQQIVSEKIIRRTMKEKMAGINRSMKRTCLLAAFGIGYCPWAFRNIGVSWLLCGVTTAFLILAVCYTLYLRMGMSAGMMVNSNLIEVGMKVSRMKRLSRLWLTRVGIPFMCIWIPWLMFDIMRTGNDKEYLWGVVAGCTAGAVIGGLIGFSIYRKNMDRADDILLQIEELTKGQQE